jgi:anti-sigma regulatory factor (Ser/Thr protein kinase)
MMEYRARFRGSATSVREARRAIVGYARLCGFDSVQTYEIALAAGEALANAVEHGTKDVGYITVRCSFADGELSVEVNDDGAGFDFESVGSRHRDPNAGRGFGISIMKAIMDCVQFEGRGELVRLRKRRTPARPESSATPEASPKIPDFS